VPEFADYRPETPDRKKTPDGLVIRRARVADLPAMAKIAARREGGTAATHARSLERFRLVSRRGRGLLLCTRVGPRVLGYAKVSRFTPGPGAPPNAAPPGWYLAGVLVDPEFRRRGVATALTRARLRWVAERAREVYYFANATNRVSIALHERFGFVEVTRDFWFPEVAFEGGAGILFRCDLA
jgi:ribosomal protein S18 acetylase RimI-like enzyme